MKSVRRLAGSFLILDVLFLFAACGPDQSLSRSVPPAEIPATGPITIALTGDTSFTTLEGAPSTALEVVRGATVALTNLEVNLLDADGVRRAEARPTPHWIFARASDARRLRDLGFDAVALANNHAMDFGADGLNATLRALDASGITHMGAGADLDLARAPGVLGGPARRLAFIAVTASASDQSRASASQPDIHGRPGVSPLAYDATVTVDAATFRTLAQSVLSLQAGPPPGDSEFTMFGRRIRKGDDTRVEFALAASEEQPVLAVIRAAREQAGLVIVSLHSHEPVNESETPAEFARQFARDAIDAGAQLVVGHGPHRLRGVEIYKNTAIFYSLGNFLFDTNGLDFRAADPFDAGNNLYTAALGASAPSASPFAQLDQDWWWQSVMVVATAGDGNLTEVKVYPVTLKTADQAGRRGWPQLADGDTAVTILRQFSGLSRQLGTNVHVEDSGAVADLPISKIR